MIRFKIDLDSTNLLDKIKSIYKFKYDSIANRIAIAISIYRGVKYDGTENVNLQNGREFSPTSNLFGRVIGDIDNYVIYKAIFDQYYSTELSESDFIKHYKFHLSEGLHYWHNYIEKCNITNGDHITFILNFVEKGLSLRSSITKTNFDISFTEYKNEYIKILNLEFGDFEDGSIFNARINDLQEFDNRNIAIAGMAGSGKTQLIKDILYQISNKTQNELKFIYFDYKGEGNVDQLKPFLKLTKTKFVDILNDNGLDFNPFSLISLDKRHRNFSIKTFVETIATFVPNIGVAQQNILKNIISELYDSKNNMHPTLNELFLALDNYYIQNNKKHDSLYAAVQDLNSNLFNCENNSNLFFDSNVYLNLPPALSDVLRQLTVFFILRYFHSFFSSLNDCIPNENVFPLRYVIVIDEAHVFFRNRNARKVLEDLLRVLRSKGVIIILLSQGVEDYKTKEFDFASQIKLPICLNVQNKDYKNISNFLGTPKSKFKLENEIKKLDSGFGLINKGEPQIFNLRQWWKTEKNINN